MCPPQSDRRARFSDPDPVAVLHWVGEIMDDGVLAHPIFAGTQHDTLKPLLAGVKARVFAAGESVSRPETSWPVMQLLVEGRLCLFELTRDGRRIILDYIHPGGVDGMVVAGRRGHFAVARGRTRGAPMGPALIANLFPPAPPLATTLPRSSGAWRHPGEA